jgi:shikimate kinase
MGCGKSSVAKYIANFADLKHIDLDEYIVNKESRSISDIFNLSGELEFRKIERAYLIELLNSREKLILSLGGGTPCYYDNMKFILNYTKNICFINTPNNILAIRLFKEKSKRPLLSLIDSENKMLEYVSKHLFERLPFYNKAPFKINSKEKNVSEISIEIIKMINL